MQKHNYKIKKYKNNARKIDKDIIYISMHISLLISSRQKARETCNLHH